MKFKLPRLNAIQLRELAKVFLDIGKAIFLGSVVAFFIPSLVDKEVPISGFLIGLFSSLTSITVGIIILSRGEKR